MGKSFNGLCALAYDHLGETKAHEALQLLIEGIDLRGATMPLILALSKSPP